MYRPYTFSGLTPEWYFENLKRSFITCIWNAYFFAFHFGSPILKCILEVLIKRYIDKKAFRENICTYPCDNCQKLPQDVFQTTVGVSSVYIPMTIARNFREMWLEKLSVFLVFTSPKHNIKSKLFSSFESALLKSLEKTKAIFLYWFAAQQQTSSNRPKKWACFT